MNITGSFMSSDKPKSVTNLANIMGSKELSFQESQFDLSSFINATKWTLETDVVFKLWIKDCAFDFFWEIVKDSRSKEGKWNK